MPVLRQGTSLVAHTGGAAALDLPPWLLAYGVAAVVVVLTMGLRARVALVSPTDGTAGDATDAGSVPPRGGGTGASPVTDGVPRHERPARSRNGRAGAGIRRIRVLGRVLGLAGLGLVVAAAFVGPDRSAANPAPSLALVVWPIGLPLACAVGGDVMAWLDPFGTLSAPLRRRVGSARPAGRVTASAQPVALTAAGTLAVFTWWSLAYHGGRSPDALGAFLVGYTVLAVVAVAAASAAGAAHPRVGEGFGAVSAGLAAARRRVVSDAGTDAVRGAAAAPPSDVVLAVAAVWAGGLAFDLFTGTRAWVELAGSASGWPRTARATACLTVALALAAGAIRTTVRTARPSNRPATDRELADRSDPDRSDPSGYDHGHARAAGWTRRAVASAWLAAAAGAVVAHGTTLLLLDGQLALALVSDPFGRGWDLFGTADRTIDYSPLTAGWVGALQVGAALAGGAWAVVAAARALAAGRREGLAPRHALRALWVAGLSAAAVAGTVVAMLAADLE